MEYKEFVKELREREGLSYRSFARAVRVSHMTVSNWEHGKLGARTPDILAGVLLRAQPGTWPHELAERGLQILGEGEPVKET